MPKINPFLKLKNQFTELLASENSNWCLWIPVIFGLGTIFFFSFANPKISLKIPLILLGLSFLSAALLKEELKSLIPIIIAIFLSGFFWSKFYDLAFLGTPKITSDTFVTAIAKIDSISQNNFGGQKITLSDLSLFQSNFFSQKSEIKAKKIKKKKIKKKKSPKKTKISKEKKAKKNKTTGKKDKKKKAKKLKESKKKKPVKITKTIEKTYLNLKGYTEIDREFEKSSEVNRFHNNKYQNPPKKILITLRKSNQEIAIGDFIKVKLLLQPYDPKSQINVFDFERNFYFGNIGGTGFALGQIKIIEKNLSNKYLDQINLWRFEIFKQISRDFLDLNQAGIFAAFLVGIRDSISPILNQNITNSGLAHLLSISGLHLSLAAAIFFFSFRFLLSRFEFFALNFNIKKIAATLAILSSLSYLIIAGAPIPAIRSFFTVALIFLAILFDRNTNPLRSLALAALLILVLNPPAVFSISFQMSFAAILALITFYNFLKKFQKENEDKNFLTKFFDYLGAIIASSIIATTVLTPFIIYYFNNFQTYGILANLIAIPLTSFLIMPLAFIYLILLPLNLQFLTIYPLQFALSGIVKTANLVANLPYSNIAVSLISTNSMLLIILGFLWLCLWERNWRYLGLILIFGGVFLAYKTPLPNLIIDGKRQFVAIYEEEKGLFFNKKVRSSMRVSSLMQKMAQKKFKTFKEMNDANNFCSTNLCQAEIKGKKILILTGRNKISELCQTDFDFLINLSKYQIPSCIKPNLNKTIINNFDLEKSGSQYLYF